MALSQLRFTKRRQARHGEEDVDEAACSGSGRLVVNYGDGVKHLEEGVHLCRKPALYVRQAGMYECVQSFEVDRRLRYTSSHAQHLLVHGDLA